MLVIIPIIWGIRNFLTYRKLTSTFKNPPWSTLINSAVMYALAFNLVFFAQELFLVLGKKSLGLQSYLYHNNHTWEGSHPMDSLMQGSGALAIFIIGLICLLIHHFASPSRSIWRVLLAWLTFHGLAQSLPQLTVAVLDPGTDVGEALVGYLQLSRPVLVLLAVSAVIGLAVLNVRFSKIFLAFAPDSFNSNNPKDRQAYLRSVVVGAAVLGSFLVIPFRIPPMSQAMTPFIVALFSIPWIWVAGSLAGNVLPNSNRINEKIRWEPLPLLILLLMIFQLVLARGVVF